MRVWYNLPSLRARLASTMMINNGISALVIPKKETKIVIVRKKRNKNTILI
jgi:hypothetical protein